MRKTEAKVKPQLQVTNSKILGKFKMRLAGYLAGYLLSYSYTP